MPFIVFLIEIFWELYRYHQEEKLAQSAAAQNKWLNGDKKTDAIKIPFKGQVRLAIVFFTVVFIFGYAVVAISHYNNNWMAHSMTWRPIKKYFFSHFLLTLEIYTQI